MGPVGPGSGSYGSDDPRPGPRPFGPGGPGPRPSGPGGRPGFGFREGDERRGPAQDRPGGSGPRRPTPRPFPPRRDAARGAPPWGDATPPWDRDRDRDREPGADWSDEPARPPRPFRPSRATGPGAAGPRPWTPRPAPGPSREDRGDDRPIRPEPQPRREGAEPLEPRARGPWGAEPRERAPWARPARPIPRRPLGSSSADGLAEDEEVVAGRRPVEEAFAARRPAKRLLVVPQRRQALERIVLHATTLRIPIVEVEGGTLTALAGFDGHQGVALVVEPRRFATLDDVLARAISRGEAPFVLVLDSLEDPQNVGTLLRSAEAAGVHGVIFPTERQAPHTPAAIKASAGATEHLLLCPVDDLPGALADLRIRGLRVIGSDAEAPLTARQADLRGPAAIVVGSEGHGLSPVVRRRCDAFVRIPMRGQVGSLNAAVAGSVLLFEALGQRDPAARPAPSDRGYETDPRDAEPDLLAAAVDLEAASTARASTAPVSSPDLDPAPPARKRPSRAKTAAPLAILATEAVPGSGSAPAPEPVPATEAAPEPAPASRKRASRAKAATGEASAPEARKRRVSRARTKTVVEPTTAPSVAEAGDDLLPGGPSVEGGA